MGAEMNEREALKLALEALDCICSPLHVREITKVGNAMKAIREALAQPEQESDDLTAAYLSGLHDGKNKYAPQPEPEPVTLQINSIPPFKNPPNDVIDAAFHVSNWAQRNNWTKWRIGKCCSVDYTAPPRREWIGLTEEERDHFEGLHLYAARNQVEAWIEGLPAFIDAIEAKLREKNTYTTPPQRKPLPPQSPCEMTQAEGKMFKLGWLECEAAHGIKEE